ncbi:MAG: stage 0 sporulation protein [Acholeplasmatales bacterium]|jgi:cell fate regulator YaaT (PSP1 superfamily)|nr:stage 0 sporulation protein [Acholeplasmatales bacterium]
MQLVLVQLKEVGKKQYFLPMKNITLVPNEKVVVETPKGIELAYVVNNVDLEIDATELKTIIRVATTDDLNVYDYNKTLNDEVVTTIKELVKKHKLVMKILSSEYTLDRKKLLIYFESDNRIDFRELVKDISEIYHTRIELRQIGSRDATKQLGGVGPCGYPTCCSTFLGDFEVVGIKNAKNQDLALNTTKLSGLCDKLLCCLKYEDSLYVEFKKNLPRVGSVIETPKGKATVVDINILARSAKVRYDDESFGYIEFHDKD